MLQEITSRVVGDTLGRITASIASQAEAGQSNARVDPNDMQKLKLAQKAANTTDRATPLSPTDTKTLAGVVSKSVQTSRIPDFSNKMQRAQGSNQGSVGTSGSTGSVGTESVGETAEGKMQYPANYAPKRDRDPRHPANRGVSANPGFVGG
jgi:hypothetical protein